MASWRDHMAAAIAPVGAAAAGKGADGLFHPACLIHTTFKLAAPRIGGLNYLDALGDWLFGRGGSHRHVDACGGVMCGSCTAQGAAPATVEERP
jgi:hypothetical protein